MSVAAPHTLPRTSARTSPRWVDLLSANVVVIAVVAAWAALLALSMPRLLSQDSWLAFVDGRLIAEHGLPNVDTLTYWTIGREWTDQQWGAHLLLYEIVQHLGLRGAAAFGAVSVVAVLGAAAVFGRGLGGSARATALAVCLPILAAPWLVQLRTQSTALVLFVLVYGLLALDSKATSRRVLLVVPLLVVWANLHGSVAMGAGLACLYGLTRLQRPPARLGAVVLAAAPLVLVVSPYGLRLVDYYRLMLFHPPLASFVDEWQPPTLQGRTALYFASLIIAGILYVWQRRRLTSFEQWALPLLALASLTAARNAIWFELALAIALPRLLDRRKAHEFLPAPIAWARAITAIVAISAASMLMFAETGKPSRWFDPDEAAASLVAHAAGASGIVLADDEHADWLLWHAPQLTGRVAYDVRFELFDKRELTEITLLHRDNRAVWQRCGVTASVVTFATPTAFRAAVKDGLLPGRGLITHSPTFVAVRQSAGGANGCRL